METLSGGKGHTTLRRLIAYADKVFGFSGGIVAGVMDRRKQPRIATGLIVQSVTVLFWARLGSLNALELTAQSSFFRRWLGEALCSADSVGRIVGLMEPSGIRAAIHSVYSQLKRNKALPKLTCESHATAHSPRLNRLTAQTKRRVSKYALLNRVYCNKPMNRAT